MRKYFIILIPVIFFLLACSSNVRKPMPSKGVKPISKSGAEKLIKGSLHHIGEPYRYGGTTRRGWDCSGFVRGMFGIYLRLTLPRDTKKQYWASVPVKKSSARPGDLVFFKIRSSNPSHVGIYLGRNKFIHASTSKGVIVSNLSEKYYKKYFIGIRRLKESYYAQSN